MSGCWSEATVAGKQVDVFEPTSATEPARAVIHLHGHGLTTLRDNPVFTPELEKHGLITLCPHAQRSWWLDRVCEEFDDEMTPMRFLLEHVVPYLKDRWGIEPPAIGLTGISMGGQGILQLSYRHPRLFPVVAAISPAVDFHNWFDTGLPLDDLFENREEARQETVTLQIHPLNWPRHQLLVCDPTDDDWFEGVERLAMKLSSSGIAHERDFETSHGGHSWDYFEHVAPRVVGFVAEKLASVLSSAG